MALPLPKLGTLVVKMLSKPIASRLKQQAKLHPRFRQLIIDLAKALRERDNDLACELEHLKHQLEEIERLPKGRGLSRLSHIKPGSREDAKLPKPSSLDS